MNPVVITVDTVEPPAEGKKQGKVFDSTGKRWGVWADKIGQFVPGATYSLTKIKSNVYQGKTYYTVEEFAPINGRGYTPQAAPSRQGQVGAPAQGYGNKDQQIFVCGIMNNMAGNPNVNFLGMSILDKVQLVEELRYVFDVTFGGKPRRQANPPQEAEDMNDSIPF